MSRNIKKLLCRTVVAFLGIFLEVVIWNTAIYTISSWIPRSYTKPTACYTGSVQQANKCQCVLPALLSSLREDETIRSSLPFHLPLALLVPSQRRRASSVSFRLQRPLFLLSYPLKFHLLIRLSENFWDSFTRSADLKPWKVLIPGKSWLGVKQECKPGVITKSSKTINVNRDIALPVNFLFLASTNSDWFVVCSSKNCIGSIISWLMRSCTCIDQSHLADSWTT